MVIASPTPGRSSLPTTRRVIGPHKAVATRSPGLARIVPLMGLIAAFPLLAGATSVNLFVPEYPGDSVRPRREGSNDLLGVEHALSASVDGRTGLPLGALEHTPVVVVKLVDQSTPGFLRALTTGQSLESVTINFYQVQGDGTEALFYTIELNNARIVGVETEHDEINAPENAGHEVLERVSFTYQRITWIHHPTGAETTATWIAEP